MIDRESLVLCSYYLDNPALRRFHAIIRPEQFQEPGTSMLFTVLQKYHQEYGRMPTHQEAETEVRDYRGPKQHEEDSALDSSSTVGDASWPQLVDSKQGDACQREILVSRLICK